LRVVDLWNKRFAESEFLYGISPNHFLEKQLSLLPPGRLFLPAEGEGRNAVWAAQKGWEVEAVDFSSEARKKAMELAEIKHVSFDYILSPLSEYDFPENAFDAVGLVFVHLSPEMRIFLHERVIHSLKKGGVIILEAFSKRQKQNTSGGPKDEEWLYSLNELSCDFSSLQLIEKHEKQIVIDEGVGHQGKADIVQYVARKI
jgi:ubiquinone/menaquinone biosynthesis C-methylase UbiE